MKKIYFVSQQWSLNGETSVEFSDAFLSKEDCRTELKDLVSYELAESQYVSDYDTYKKRWSNADAWLAEDRMTGDWVMFRVEFIDLHE